MSSSDRALVNAFKEISNMADRINLPRTIVDRANNLFKQVHDGKNLKGRSNDAIASACLYISCRQVEGFQKTFYSFLFFILYLTGKKAFRVLSKRFAPSVKSVRKRLGGALNSFSRPWKLPSTSSLLRISCPVSALILVSRTCSTM